MRAGQASETARRVAAYRLSFPRLPAAYGDAGADERLSRDVAGSTRSEGRLHAYLQARTRFFDRVVVGAVDGGIDQIVVGAAGYDGRALRYAKPGVRWFEVDHPDTQEDKLRRVAALGIDAGHVRFVPADFDTDPLGPGLLAAGFDRTRPGLFLLEGVAVYLSRSTLESVLGQLRHLAGPGSRLAISLSVAGGSGSVDARRTAFREGVAALGEPVRSGIAPEERDAFLASAGWRVPDGDGSGDETGPGSGDGSERARGAGLVLAVPA